MSGSVPFQRFIPALLALLPLAGQTPQAAPHPVPKVVDKAFFAQDPKTLMLLCTEEGRRLDPKDSHLLVEVGDVYLTHGNRAKAEEAFNQAERTSSHGPDRQTRRLIGLAWLRHGFKAEALEAYKAMETTPTNWEKEVYALLNAAKDLAGAGMAKEGAEYLMKAMKVDKDARKDAEARLDFARIALLAGQRDMAATYFSQAIQLDPKDETIWSRIADAYSDFLIAHPEGAPPLGSPALGTPIGPAH